MIIREFVDVKQKIRPARKNLEACDWQEESWNTQNIAFSYKEMANPKKLTINPIVTKRATNSIVSFLLIVPPMPKAYHA